MKQLTKDLAENQKKLDEMNRLFSLFLTLLMLLSCTACVGRAAAPDPAHGQAETLEASAPQPREPEEPSAPAAEPPVGGPGWVPGPRRR